MGKNRDTVESLKADVSRLKLRIQLLELKIEQQQDLHREWVQSMTAMHGAAVETLERIRVEEQHRRALTEQQVEVRHGSDARNGVFSR